MPMLVAGLLLLWLSSILLRGFTKSDPAVLARLVRRVGGAAVLGLAVFLLVRGELNLAIVASGFGLWLLGSADGGLAAVFGTGPSFGRGGSARSFRSASLAMQLDPAKRHLVGAFVAGPFAGRSLDDLSWPESLEAYRWCVAADPAGARLFERYLDGRFTGWRQASDFAGDPGGAEPGRGGGGPAGMPDHEAYHVLGLAQGASREEIASAHRRLMKKYHPDHGGSTAMAARVNQAKDVLMRRHPRTRFTQ